MRGLKTSFSLGDCVLLPVPEEGDRWLACEKATVVGFDGTGWVRVVDEDGDLYEIESKRLFAAVEETDSAARKTSEDRNRVANGGEVCVAYRGKKHALVGRLKNSGRGLFLLKPLDPYLLVDGSDPDLDLGVGGGAGACEVD